ncbi:MAG: hypothetical protein PF692_15670 [Kiritimatiellae bacterium]|jgi:hypothetical protein|nr:hypothetical protein [Kiritimatiellia bacterium]
MYKKLILLGTIMIISFGNAEEQIKVKNQVINPNEQVQCFLQMLSSTNLLERQKLFPDGITSEFVLKAKLNDFKEESGGNSEFIAQLLFFKVNANNEMEKLLPLYIMEQLNISKTDQYAGIIPYIGTTNDVMKAEIYEWLENIDYDQKKHSYQFNHYKNLIQKNMYTKNMELVKYMYTTSPESALSTFANINFSKYKAKSLMDKTKYSDKSKTIKVLADNTEWWIQLYILELMSQKPKLIVPEIIKEFELSNNYIVSNMVQKIQNEQINFE